MDGQLSVPRSEQFSQRQSWQKNCELNRLKENCEPQETDIVQGKESQRIV